VVRPVLLAEDIEVSELAALRYRPGDPDRSDVDLAAREIRCLSWARIARNTAVIRALHVTQEPPTSPTGSSHGRRSLSAIEVLSAIHRSWGDIPGQCE
jgi:hypothetical protein